MRNYSITAAQLKALQASFSRKGFSAEDRHEFILNYTNGRTDSTKGLTLNEAKALLQEFNGVSKKQKEAQQKEAKKLVGAIYFLSLGISFLNKGFETTTEEDRLMNIAKINQFCRARSKYKKNLTAMSLDELKEVHKQFEALYRKENGKQGSAKTTSDKAVQGSHRTIR